MVGGHGGGGRALKGEGGPRRAGEVARAQKVREAGVRPYRRRPAPTAEPLQLPSYGGDGRKSKKPEANHAKQGAGLKREPRIRLTPVQADAAARRADVGRSAFVAKTTVRPRPGQHLPSGLSVDVRLVFWWNNSHHDDSSLRAFPVCLPGAKQTHSKTQSCLKTRDARVSWSGVFGGSPSKSFPCLTPAVKVNPRADVLPAFLFSNPHQTQHAADQR